MYYKEFLRVRNLFYTFAICVGALAVLIFFLGGHAHVSVDATDQPAHAAAAHARRAMAQSGFASATASSDNVQAPGIEINDTHHVPFSVLFAFAGFVAALFASVLGACLAAENCHHLEIAWTRPATRIGYALVLMLVDSAGIIAMFAFTVFVVFALVYLSGWQRYLYMSDNFWPSAVRQLAYAFSWFGLIAALTASARTKAGAIVGFAWVGAALLIVLLVSNLPPAIHMVVNALNYLNPLLYASTASNEHGSHDVIAAPWAMAGLVGIAALGIITALAQWRRLEA